MGPDQMMTRIDGQKLAGEVMVYRLYRMVAAVLLVAGLSSCAADRSGNGSGPSREPGFSLTIYSTANPATFSAQDALQQALQNQTYGAGPLVTVPGYSVVREVRKMSLKAGVNRVEFPDVAAGIDPTTVAFRSLTEPATTAVLEQNFDFDLGSADKLVNKYLGKEVVLVSKRRNMPPGGTDGSNAVTGTLLSYDTGWNGLPTYVVQTLDPTHPVVVQSGDNIAYVRLAGAGAGLISKPTLNWKIAAEKAGIHDVQVTYQTDGITWRADYNVVLSADESRADLSAWVTVLNGSGRSYPDARLKLIAGQVQRVEPQHVQNTGLFGGAAAQETRGFEEKGFFEYHLYTLGRPATVPNNSTKQIELFSAKSGVQVDKVYLYYGLSEQERYNIEPAPYLDHTLKTEANTSVDVYVRFKNSEVNHLGIPLPAGKVRLYKVDDADGNREFIGEDVIQHTPKDEPVLLRLGAAFDLIGDRKQVEYNEDTNSATEKFEITLRNHKNAPAQVIVMENLLRWSNWEITESSDKWVKLDYRTVHFPVDVPAGGEKKVTYTVRYTW